MPWVLLVLAGLFEVGWAVGLKYTEGFTRLWPSVFTIAAMIASLWLLGIAMRTIPVGAAYGVWVGIGTLGTAVVGMVWLGDAVTVLRCLSIGLILAGVVGLKLAG